MSAPSAIIPLSTKRKQKKMTKDEKIAKVTELAKAQFGDNYLACLWGSSRVLLSDNDLNIILKVLENK